MAEADIPAPGDARTPPVAVWQILEKLRGQDLVDWRLANVEGRASVEERNLDIGFPFGWYAMLPSADLAAGEVKPLRYFAKDLAIWRGEDGEVRMVDAYCRHLGAHLGHGGKVSGNLLECPFHAWRYDGTEGNVKEIPYTKIIPPQVKRKCIRTWHIVEANRWIWAWYHPHDIEPLFEPVHIPECSDPDWTDYEVFEWNVWANIQNMAENGVDVAHFKYIHGTSNVPLGELRWSEWGRGADVRAKMGTPWGEVDGCISYDTMGPGQSWTRFTGISETLLIACITPVDLDHVHTRFCFTQPRSQAEGERAGVAKAIIRDICKQYDQDKVIWDRQKFEPEPVICAGDGPIADFRKFYSRYYVEGEGVPASRKRD
ncbi:Rieske 2Fe-2S domain-containing protein [Novosphingobium panipatense]|uniref:Rieske 2Fe-2S domain-containing protein n=1 Tax=Novosphingobium TaxID=165696 RepID=UPI0018EB7720|nr:Rieske 2Fe-2S domain-containing protein [Novosphingobium sp. HII-3]